MLTNMVEPIPFKASDEILAKQKQDSVFSTASPFDFKGGSSYHIDLYLKNVKKDEDYFANDDSVIRSPTFYTRTNLGGDYPSTDLRSLLTPMWDEELKENDPALMST